MNFRHRKFDVRPKEHGVNFTDLMFEFQTSRTERIGRRRQREPRDRLADAAGALVGCNIENLSTRHFRISGSGMHFDDFRLKTAESDVRMAYLYFDYDTWKGYNDF